MDDDFCRERIRTIKELADNADPFIRRRLLELAIHYEKRLIVGAKQEATLPRHSNELIA
ncbi:hypothetical protein ACNJX9_04505 [Bradyrhizobium sp. DASA03076]|uniref:hypothetical protein n=1 Tax=Bradyrhizobium sp. BLXBL-03 TaxID=3395916 RepID=UPI003F728557